MQMNLMKIIVNYNEAHRHYHNLTHIRRLFNTATRHNIYLTDTQRVAIFFHDIIYDPKSSTNEEDSVTRMRELCRAETPEDEIVLNNAEQIILYTKHHVFPEVETAIVLDLDLHELGADWDRFVYNDKNIRKEYSFVSDEQWVVGRGDFMEKMLNRPHIFNTALFRQQYEETARYNIKTLLTELGRNIT